MYILLPKGRPSSSSVPQEWSAKHPVTTSEPWEPSSASPQVSPHFLSSVTLWFTPFSPAPLPHLCWAFPTWKRSQHFSFDSHLLPSNPVSTITSQWSHQSMWTCFNQQEFPVALRAGPHPLAWHACNLLVIQLSSLTFSPAKIPICFRPPNRPHPSFISSLVPSCFCAFFKKKCFFCFDHPPSFLSTQRPSSSFKNWLRHQFLWLISPAVVLQPRAGPFYLLTP